MTYTFFRYSKDIIFVSISNEIERRKKVNYFQSASYLRKNKNRFIFGIRNKNSKLKRE